MGNAHTVLNQEEPDYPCEDLDMTELTSPSKHIQELNRALDRLYFQVLSKDGHLIDYDALRSSSSSCAKDWHKIQHLAFHLQSIKISALTRAERLAFFINVYNVMTIHGMLITDPPSSLCSLLKFYSSTAYIIDGKIYTMNGIEHGILRGNQRMPFWLCRQYGRNSIQAGYANVPFDPRVHFTINCGGKSCSPIRLYDGQHIQDQLTLAAQVWVNEDSNIRLDEAQHVIHLSQLFRLFPTDFAIKGDYLDIVLNLKSSFSTEKQGVIERMVARVDNTITFEWIHYDLDLNQWQK